MIVDQAEKGARYQVELPDGTVHDLPVVAERLQTDASHPDYHEHQLSNKGYRADGLTGAQRLAHREARR